MQPVGRNADFDDGPFAVAITVAGIDHQGQIPYDDDGDDVPDRFEPSIGLAAYEFTLAFDPSVVVVDDVEGGAILEAAGRDPQCFEQTPRRGEHAVGCVSLGGRTGPQGDGELARVTFRPIANGSSWLAMQGRLSGPLGDPIPTSWSGGVVRVTGAPEDAPDNPGSPDNNPNPPAAAAGNGDGSAPPNANANTDPSGLPGADPARGTIVEGGIDLDGDGVADIPLAGTGGPSEQRGWPASVAGAFAVIGAVLLGVGYRLLPARRRPAD
jgi:hypothetical protein